MNTEAPLIESNELIIIILIKRYNYRVYQVINARLELKNCIILNITAKALRLVFGFSCTFPVSLRLTR
jgi:hypothetical protein